MKKIVLVAKALETPRPKTRYAIGQGAKIGIFLRWLLPDRAMDRVMKTLIS